MPNFRIAPFCRPAVLASAEPRTMDGNRIADWDIETAAGDLLVLSSADLRATGYAIGTQDNGAGIYALASGDPVRYVIHYNDDVVEFEDGTLKPFKEFLRSAVRTDKNGKTICSFVEPFHKQFEACKEFGSDASVHRYDLQEMVDNKRQGEFKDVVGMYDIVASGLEDTVPFFDRMRHMTAASWSADALESISSVGVPAEAWHEIKDMPQYGMDQVRAMFRMLMDPYIGDFPIERVKRIHLPPGAPLADIFEGPGTLIAVKEPFSAGNIIRGYKTSEVHHFSLPGVEAVVFDDAGGTYAYAWPVNPKPTADIAPGAKP